MTKFILSMLAVTIAMSSQASADYCEWVLTKDYGTLNFFEYLTCVYWEGIYPEEVDDKILFKLILIFIITSKL